MKKTISTLFLVASAWGTGMAQAQTIVAEFQGPGGHSSGNYGRTSALHAAARAMMEFQKSGLPAGSYSVSELTGGNSVNSIASDGKFVVKLNAQSGVSESDLLAKVTAAAKAGTDAENAFRNVKPGDLTAGAPADIRYSVTQP
ncbi:peptidase dimerization domain-containing protein [Comamonas odontotermitis]|uniref:peptidase dimerization domain-containing protein n=1 Tax=Comamonas odontotermitis TaxID=379895 RepID=UPI001CC4F3A4|nr:peptidase dimerization domain-containing protein [Comamonas odontotermitis]UBB16978.1 peptidase dimerization domain-containing protein [Comamonas odontotermitis]